VQLQFGFYVLVGDFQADLVSSADQARPRDLGLEPVLKRIGAGAAAD
jgi:hypothetical protein